MMIIIEFRFQIFVKYIILNCSRAKQCKSYKYWTPSAIPQVENINIMFINYVKINKLEVLRSF